MAHKLDRFRDQIEVFKATGDSVREIARKLSEMSGEKVAASTVQWWLKQGNGNGESKESVQVDQAALVERLDHVQVCLDELAKQVTEINGQVHLVWEDWGDGARVLRSTRGEGRALKMEISIPRPWYWDYNRPFWEWQSRMRRRLLSKVGLHWSQPVGSRIWDLVQLCVEAYRLLLKWAGAFLAGVGLGALLDAWLRIF